MKYIPMVIVLLGLIIITIILSNGAESITAKRQQNQDKVSAILDKLK
jgi:hypothetical protein